MVLACRFDGLIQLDGLHPKKPESCSATARVLGELSAVARSSRCLPVAAPHSTLGRLSAACGRPGEPAEWPLWLRWAFSGGRRALDGNPTAAAAATSCCCKAVVLIKTWPGAVSHQRCQGPSFQAAQSCGDRGPSLCQVDEPRDCIHHPDMVPKSRTKAKNGLE